MNGWFSLLRRAVTPWDGGVLLVTATGIVVAILLPFLTPASHATVVVDNQPRMQLDLRQDGLYGVEGHLGQVAIEVAHQRVRLLEYASPRMIGTRSGWIGANGQMVACVPCRVVIQVHGSSTEEGGYDAISR
ncbi:MAG: hypothetical protein G8345_07035 [Magnetococcales bacterium]|nr:NusG domain II-containing protein [Magnetococcales bacterium]NGZ26626.1 hypothetical protein [Magnetococcales bacterium]